MAASLRGDRHDDSPPLRKPARSGVPGRLMQPGALARRWALPLIAALLFGAALWVLHGELQSVHPTEVREALRALPAQRLLLALALVGANYLVLAGYDLLAFVHAGPRPGRRHVVCTALLAFAISNNVGFALLSGAAVRYHFLSRHGVDAQQLSRAMLFSSTTFWLGLCALGGATLAFGPALGQGAATGSAPIRIAGFGLLSLAAAYLVACVLRKAPLRLRGFEYRLPRLPLALGQLGLSIADWMLAAAVLHALLPAGGPPYTVVLGAFLAAQFLGLASHVPGGLGVFEGTVVVLLGGWVPHAELLSALLLYRIAYYMLPLGLALAYLVAHEARRRREHLPGVGNALGTLSAQLVPKLLAAVLFVGGAVLLFSGATPAEPDRMRWLDRILPLAVFETSHFLGSIAGVGLLIVARGVARRLRIAWRLALLGLLAGIVASLAKGGDWEEALLLALILLALLAARAGFDRPTAMLGLRQTPGWIVAIVCAFGASIWLGLFAYRHVEYADTLWWQFALEHDVSRWLRASVGAAVALSAFGAMRLLRPAPPLAAPPSDEDLVDAARVIDRQSHTMAQLVFLRDKSLIFDADRNAFLMYGVQGRSWVALGDPVGDPAAAPGLVRSFVERAADAGGTPVFYQVRPDCLHVYADMGMSFTKLGEEARVSLADFSLEGGAHRGQRNTLSQLARQGLRFRVLPPDDVPARLPELKAISDDWLSHKAASEKGFSLGRFDPDYLARFPLAVMETVATAPDRTGGASGSETRIEAFANLWASADRCELSIDLMRHRDTAPRKVMDGLFIELFRWGHDNGYRWFNLGMAPLSGIAASMRVPIRVRLGGWLYRHGEPFYNFQGLRAFKEKFDPAWEPRYLAHPVGPSLPRVLADIAALIAGGYTRVFR